MKIEYLKISFLYLTLFLFSIHASGQQEYYCAPKERLEITTNPKHPVNYEYHKKLNRFDWTKDSFKIESDFFPNINYVASPFFQSENPGVRNLVYSKDMMPVDGWELIDLVSESQESLSSNEDYPNFILYNKYLGIIRNFVILKPFIKEGYKYMIDFVGGYIGYNKEPLSSVFNNIKPLNSLDNFNDYTTKYYYPFFSGPGFWNWGDINVIYDPCSCQHQIEIYIRNYLFQWREIIIDGKKVYESSEYSYGGDIFGLPGSDFDEHCYNESVKFSDYPYYNNILGTFNLLRTPEINYTSRFRKDYEYAFKLSKDLEYIVNPAAGFVMDSIDLNARFVIEFSKFPAVNTEDNLFRINDTTYESNEIPIGCLKDFTLRFKTPFSDPPKKVYFKLSGNFIKNERNGKTPDQYLDLSFRVNLTNYKLKSFEDDYWTNQYNNECHTKVLPYNLDYNKMNDFCSGKEYINDEKYVTKRNYRKIIDTVEKIQEVITETRLYDLYPNPAKDRLFIEFAVDSRTDIKFYLIDELGKEIPELFLSDNKDRGRYRLELGIQGIAQGIYYGVFECNMRKDIKKVIIIR
jgi:hypothetical protein